MSANARHFIVGLISLIAIVSFFALLMLFGELDEWRTHRYTLTLYMNTAGGLRSGSTVDLNGVPAGRIEAIALDPSPQRAEYPVRVTAMIEREIRIPAATVGAVDSQLIAGAATLQLKSAPFSPGEQPQYLPDDGTASIFIDHKPLLEQLVHELDARTEPLIRAMNSFEQLSQTYIKVGNNLNALITPQDPQAIATGEPPNLHAAVQRFHEILNETQISLQLAQNWLGDEQLRQEVRDAVINARRLIEDAAATLEQVATFATRLETRTDEIAERLVPVADELAVIFEQVRQITSIAAEGEGTIAQLLNNPDLYNNLNDSAIRLERALREVQLFIQKVTAEGLPVRWF